MISAYQWTAAFMGLSVGLVIIWLVRRAHLHGPYAIWWILVAAGVVLAGLFPHAIDAVGSLLGVNYPPVLAVVVAIGALLVKVLTMDLERTRQEVALRRLTQRLAMLEAELQGRSAPASGRSAADAPGLGGLVAEAGASDAAAAPNP
ncbi:MAG: hypothetical protein RI988_1466 [Pseudomonadota bacterium]|jgi:hypothetical protein